MKSACFAAAAALVEVVAGLNVYHRVWDPSQSQSQSSPPFTLRGTLEGNPLSLTLADTLISNPDSLDSSLYQIALEREGDASSDDWDLSSVKACHLRTLESDVVSIHLSADGKPYALDYFLRPVPHDGSCPTSSVIRPLSFSNTTLIAHVATPVPLPDLRTPPPLSPTGQPIPPPPEKSFIQKYGIYIGLAALVLMLTGGSSAPEEEGGGGARPARR